MAIMSSISVRSVRGSNGKSKFMVDYYDQWGQRKRPSFKTEREAKDFKRQLILKLAGVQTEPLTASPDIPLSEAIRRYDELKSANKASQTEERRYFQKLYDFFTDKLRIFSVQEVQPIHVEQFQIQLRKSVSASTVNRHFNTYRNFFSTLLRWGVLIRNPTIGLENLQINPTVRQVWDLEECKAILAAVPKQYGDFLFFMAHTGARNKEVKDLNWEHVDFKRSLVTLRTMKGGGGAKVRLVPMTEALAQFLIEKMHEASIANRDENNDAVFVNSRGNRIQNQALDEAVVAARDQLKFKTHLTPYGLRHFLVTSLSEENQAEEKIRRLVGHSKSSTVTAAYMHLNVQSLREALESTQQARELTRNRHHWAQESNVRPPEMPGDSASDRNKKGKLVRAR